MSKTSKKTLNEIIEEFKKTHGDKYDYSKVEYINNTTKVCIICSKHGEFWQTPKQHKRGEGCKLCGYNNAVKKRTECNKHKQKCGQKKTNETFIEIANEVHHNKYDYSKVEYINTKTKICITCPKHNDFWQRPQDHLRGNGCPKCALENKAKKFQLGKEKFIQKANKIFHNYYEYEKINYINNNTKVVITCPKHGDFECTPHNHLSGRGCPKCKQESYVYENRLYRLLLKIFQNNEVIRQYKTEWLTNNKSIDFFIPKYNLAIEHQGSQHFQYVKHFGNYEKFERTVQLDKEKYQECNKNNIKLLYFTYEKNTIPTTYFDKIYIEEEDLITNIKKIINLNNIKHE